MKFDVKELEEIYLKSLSLDERIALLDELKPSEHESIYNERLKRWKNVFSRGGDHYFEQRLRWSGITKTQLQKILCDAERTSREDFAPPPWIPYLQKLISFAQRAKIKSKATYKYIYDSDPIPFEDLLIPFVELAEEELKCKITRASYNTLAKGAKCDLKRSLLKKLFEVSAQTFLQEFYERQDDRNAYYKQYIHWVRRGGYREIFLKYPVLAKLVSTCSVFWVNNSVELISRFNKDMFEIQDIFLENRRPLEKVTHIETDLSDPHNCGKAVNIIWFSGTRIVYKPRNLATEQQFYRFVTWLNKTNKNSDLKVLKTIDKKKYGWVEYIQQEECCSQKEVAAFYYNAGCLLCTLYLLGTTDCHYENIIANGINPVLIDTETLLTPLAVSNDKPINDLERLLDTIYGKSVARTGLLPQWSLSSDGRVYDNSGFGNVSSQEAPFPTRRWYDINKDSMYFQYEQLPSLPAKNVVYLRGKAVNPHTYHRHLLTGFRKTYKFLTQKKESLRKNNSFVKGFENAPIRFVFRPTKLYSILLEYLQHPSFLRSGIDRSIEIDILSKGLLSPLKRRHAFWDILKSEHEAINRLDIPYFPTTTNTKTLELEKNREIEGCFVKESIVDTEERLSTLSDKDLKFQLDLIVKSFETKITKVDSKKIKANNKHLKGSTLKKEDIITYAKAIGDLILSKAARSNDGRITWVSYVTHAASHTFGYKPIGLDLCNGNLGVAIFLSSLYRSTKVRKYKKAALLATLPVLDVLNEKWAQKELAQVVGLGGTTGLGSIIYGLQKVSEILDETHLSVRALEFSRLITKELINQDLRHDVVAGNAGGILGLLYLYKATREGQLLKKAILCGEHLLKKRKPTPLNYRTWEFQKGMFLVGFSHGSSGILYALAQLYKITKNNELYKALLEVLDYENAVFSQGDNNWPDFRTDPANTTAISWCHGATGVGFSRLGLLDIIKTPQIRKDLDIALEKTLEKDMGFVDTLCCGNFGRLDFLVSSGLLLKKGDLVKLVEQQTSRVLNRYDTTGEFNYFSNYSTSETNIGFYQGISGIGYEMLRICEPGLFGSILMWE